MRWCCGQCSVGAVAMAVETWGISYGDEMRIRRYSTSKTAWWSPSLTDISVTGIRLNISYETATRVIGPSAHYTDESWVSPLL